MGGEQRPGPGQHAFTGLGKAFEALASYHQLQAQFVLQVAQAHGQGRLSDMATCSGLPEVSSLFQCDQELELLDVHGGTCRGK
ncbi:hypothetical protein D3C75_1042420 [compost metagenome]